MYDDSQYASEQYLTSINYVKDCKQYGVLMLSLKWCTKKLGAVVFSSR